METFVIVRVLHVPNELSLFNTPSMLRGVRHAGMIICTLLYAGRQALPWFRCKQMGKNAAEELGLAVSFQTVYMEYCLFKYSLTASRKQLR